MNIPLDVEKLIDNLPDAEKAGLIAKKFRELPLEMRLQVVREEMGNSGLVIIPSSNRDLANITLSIQNAQDVDIATILEAIVKSRRREL